MEVVTIINLFVGIFCLRAYLKSDSHEDPFIITYAYLAMSAANLGMVLYKLPI